MSKRSNKWLLMGLMIVLVLAGCNRKTVYHHYRHTPLTGWDRDDTLYFAVDPMKQRAVIKRDVQLRISDKFPFQKLNLIVKQTTLPSNFTRYDTLSCDLIDQKGNVLGQGLTLYQYNFHLTDISLNEGDSLFLSIYHNMKRETLPGIADVGIRLTAY